MVIGVAKFHEGGWAILIIVPLMVWLLVRMNHRYEHEHHELEDDLTEIDHSDLRRPVALLLVDDLDRKTIHALQYAKTMRAVETHAVHFEKHEGFTEELVRQWRALRIDVPLKVVRHDGDVPSCLAGYVGALPDDTDVNVIVPGPAEMGFVERFRRGRTGAHLARALLPYQRARITLVRDHVGPGHTSIESAGRATRISMAPRFNHQAVVLVDKVDNATLRAIRYAMSLGASEVWAVHAAVDQENQEEIIRRWMDLRLPVPLEVIECWDRNVARSLEGYVVELMGKQSEVTVVMPRRDYAQLRQRMLHDRTSRKIARALGRYEHVDISVVPFYFGKRRRGAAPKPTGLRLT